MATLEQRVKDLEQKMKALDTAALPFLAHQRGALPGAMRAVSLGDAGQKSAMWLNLVGQTPGQAPYLGVEDASGIIRVEEGNLAAFTDSGGVVSPAQFGMRARDASNNLLFDTSGGPTSLGTLTNTVTLNNPTGTFPLTTAVSNLGASSSFVVNRVLFGGILLMTINAQTATNNANVFIQVTKTGGGGAAVGQPTITIPILSANQPFFVYAVLQNSIVPTTITIQPKAYASTGTATLTINTSELDGMFFGS